MDNIQLVYIIADTNVMCSGKSADKKVCRLSRSLHNHEMLTKNAKNIFRVTKVYEIKQRPNVSSIASYEEMYPRNQEVLTKYLITDPHW